MARVDVVRAQARVRKCLACPLSAGDAKAPISSPAVASFAVVGEAPGSREVQKAEPFVGPAGRRLRRSLDRAGLDPDAGAYLNAVSCLPGRNPPTPTEEEVRACTGNRVAQLLASEAGFVLACGNVALRCWRTEVSIMTAHGVPFVDGAGRVVVPSIHPSAVLRDPGQQWKLDRACGLLAMLVTGDGLAGVNVLGQRCLSCNREASRWDDGLWPWCGSHGPKEMSAGKKAKVMVAARTAANKRRQMEMF